MEIKINVSEPALSLLTEYCTNKGRDPEEVLEQAVYHLLLGLLDPPKLTTEQHAYVKSALFRVISKKLDELV